AAPASGSTFTGWSGGGCSGAGSCTVTLAGGNTGTPRLSPDGELDLISVHTAPHNAPPGSSKIPITVVLSKSSKTALSVRYTTSDGTAIAGVNYLQTSGTLNFRRGKTQATFYVQILQSAMTTPKTFNLVLSQPSAGATIGAPGSAVMTLT